MVVSVSKSFTFIFFSLAAFDRSSSACRRACMAFFTSADKFIASIVFSNCSRLTVTEDEGRGKRESEDRNKGGEGVSGCRGWGWGVWWAGAGREDCVSGLPWWQGRRAVVEWRCGGGGGVPLLPLIDVSELLHVRVDVGLHFVRVGHRGGGRRGSGGSGGGGRHWTRRGRQERGRKEESEKTAESARCGGSRERCEGRRWWSTRVAAVCTWWCESGERRRGGEVRRTVAALVSPPPPGVR